eukprot:TRINITY_DN2956_c0_g2_i1.p1 TRINITY_DN2956_c0_g2~~TRINITY_DN2956_c0_g2_i1.p1  ORF type:complete len:356 (+),score=33.88 TRINITY_DN2956_c0_g2_i1:53-1120(+)
MTTHLVKRITYFDSSVGIVMQNENGPCPLIAICNILLLRRRMRINPSVRSLLYEDLVKMLADFMIEETTRRGPENPAVEFCMQEVLDLLPVLEHGMDVNIKFKAVGECETGTGLACFDYFSIRLVHGWLPDEASSYNELIKQSSYNQITEWIIKKNEELTMDESSRDPSTIEQGTQAEEWLSDSPGQLTYTGLFALTSDLQENELCVLFRNNHFGTLTKRNGNLYSLLTDIGYVDVNDAVWESLEDINGDMKLFDSDFKPPTNLGRQGNVVAAAHAASSGTVAPPKNGNGLTQAEQEQIDFNFAQSLVHQDIKEQKRRDQRRQQVAAERRQPLPKASSSKPPPSQNKKGTDCVIS